MTEVTIRVDAETVELAARALGVWENSNIKLSSIGAEVLRELAGTRHRSALADGGAAPKRAGRSWENQVVAAAQAAGLPWDKGPLRGQRDLLDITGCLPGGWLVGAKSASRGQSAAVKLFDAMDQAERAMGFLEADGKADGVIPWQIIKRPRAETLRAYAVTEFRWFLDLARMRQAATEQRAWL
jgi:hypothetical protein